MCWTGDILTCFTALLPFFCDVLIAAIGNNLYTELANIYIYICIYIYIYIYTYIYIYVYIYV